MRFGFILALASLIFAHVLPAKDKSNWADVQKLKPGTPVLISLWAGERLHGDVEAVDASGLRLTWLDRRGALIASSYQVDRAAVRKIVRFRRSKLPRDPGRIILISTVAGAAVGATAGGIYDATHYNNGHWFTGGLTGAGVGFLGSTVVLGAVGVGEAGVLLFHRGGAVVYEDKSRVTSHGAA